MKKSIFALAIAGMLASFSAFADSPNFPFQLPLVGAEVPFEYLSKIEPNTILMIMSDKEGKTQVVKIDRSNLPRGVAFLRVTANAAGESQGGCYVLINGFLVWMDPCPYG
ncbi:MAG: hypothetical protein H6975_05170 [Gammaproteobacteria bacterium]|nr:hypothetical protein [Gammaproteobacteria bacterium]